MSQRVPASLQNRKRRGAAAAARDNLAMLAEPPREGAAPSPPNGAAREARMPSNGSGGDGAHARPNGNGISETGAEPVSGASFILEDESPILEDKADGRGAEIEASPIVEQALPPDNAGLSEEPLEAAAPANFRAHLDEVSDTEISGWIMRPDEPSHRCVVALKEGTRVLARTVASRFRPDLVPAGIGDGCHAFTLAMPRALLDGEEHVLDIVEGGDRLFADRRARALALGSGYRRCRLDRACRRERSGRGGRPCIGAVRGTTAPDSRARAIPLRPRDGRKGRRAVRL